MRESSPRLCAFFTVFVRCLRAICLVLWRIVILLFSDLRYGARNAEREQVHGAGYFRYVHKLSSRLSTFFAVFVRCLRAIFCA